MTDDQNQTIPVTAFQEESENWPLDETMHCEELSLRGEMYDWHIKAHRHLDLMQIFFVITGSGLAKVDNTDYALGAGDLLVVPQYCVHTFKWEKNSNGYVLYIARPMLSKLEHAIDNLSWAHSNGFCFSTLTQTERFTNLFASICSEYESKRSHRIVYLENLVSSLCILINRAHSDTQKIEEQKRNRGAGRVDRYLQLLEEHFTQYHTVDWYAEKVGVTASHLNSLCRKFHKQSALALIHDRLLSEAKRNLIYTAKSTHEIADMLGFSDAAYFNRFFKRLQGKTPGVFRREVSRS
jgi:AraC family transcriptional activator of pobA